MADLVAKIRVSIIDAFTAPLKHLGGELKGVRGQLGAIKASGDASSTIGSTTAAIGKLGAAARPALAQTARALGATGTAADAVKQRMEAFSKVAELTAAVRGARKFEREAHASMASSGGSADAAAKHFEAFGKLDALKQQLDEARRLERGVRASTAGMGKSLRGVNAPTKAAGNSFASLSKQAIASLMATNGKLDEGGVHLKAFEKLAELRRAEDGFKRVARAAQGIGGPIGDAGKKTASLRDNLRLLADSTIALGGIKTAFSAAATAAAVPIKKFMEYDEALGELESKLAKKGAKPGETRNTDDFRALESQIKAVGAKTKFSNTDIALTQAEFAATGFTPKQILEATPVAANLATAASTPREAVSPDQAAGILTSTLAQFELTADSAQRLSDALVAGADASKTSVTEIASQMKYVGGMANRLKMTPEQTITNLALLSNKGQDGTTAGTNMVAMLERLIAPSDAAKGGLADLGLGGAAVKEIQQLASIGKFPEIMQKLARATSIDRTYTPAEIKAAKQSTREQLQKQTKKTGQHYTEKEIQARVAKVEAGMKATANAADINEALKKIFETQGSNAFSALQANFKADPITGLTEYDKLNKTVTDSSGVTAEKTAIKEATAKGQADQLSGSLDALLTNFGSKFAPEIEKVTRLLGGFANSLSGLIDRFPEASKGIGLAGAAAVTAGGAWASVKGYAALAGKLFGGGAAAAGTAATVGAEGAALAAAGAEVAATTAATTAVASMGTASAVGGTAAVAGGGALASIGAPIAAALVPITAGLVAQRTGADVKVYDWFMSGGIGDAMASGLKGIGLNETLADTVGSVHGTAASAMLAPAAALPALGSGIGRAYDWMTGKGTEPGSDAPKAVPGAAPAMPPLLAATAPQSIPSLLARPPETGTAPLILAPKPGATPSAPASTTEPGTSTVVVPPTVIDTDTLELLQRQQLDAIRDQTKAMERQHREMAEAARRRSGGAGAGTQGVW